MVFSDSAVFATIIGFIIVTFFILTRSRIVDTYSTYAVRTADGIKRFQRNPTKLRRFPLSRQEYIVTGKPIASSFEIDTRDRDRSGEWRTKKVHLMNHSTGAIDLRIHTMEIKPFQVKTADQHQMEVHAALAFQLDRDRLFRCFQYANLSVALLTRVEGAVRAHISGRQNEEIGEEISEIRKHILDEIKKPEEDDSKTFEAWRKMQTSLDHENSYFETTSSNALGIHVADISLQIEQSDPKTPEILSGDSVMTILPRHLDNVRDMFLPTHPSLPSGENGHDAGGRSHHTPDDYMVANEALLRMLEMHTRENIARNAKGQMVVISSEDLGVARTSVFKSVLKPSETKKKIPPESK